MNCECLEFNRTKIAEHYAKQGVVNPKVSETFLGINVETGEGVITLTYTIRGDNKPYNTQKGKPLSMVASYCPWCGKSAKKDVAQQSAQGEKGGEA